MLLETNNFLKPNQYVVGITSPKKSNLSLKLKDVTRDSITVELLFFRGGLFFTIFRKSAEIRTVKKLPNRIIIVEIMNVLKATNCEKYTPAKKKQFYSKLKKYI